MNRRKLTDRRRTNRHRGNRGRSSLALPCRFRLACAWGLAAFALFCGLPAAADVVVQFSGSQQRGTIEKSTREGVVVDGQAIRANDIRYVLFDGEPRELRVIRDSVSKGSFAKAEAAMERLDRSKVQGDLQKMDLRFYEAYVGARRSLQTGQQQNAAVKQMLGFVKSHSKSFHFYDAAEVLGELASSLGQDKEAAKYFGVLEKSKSTAMRARGMSRMAELLTARESYDEALKRYEAMLSLAGDDEEAKTTALLGKALCQAQLGEGEAGIAAVEKVIAATNPKRAAIMARAYNALGACYRVAGKDDPALLAYLHVDLLYAKESDQHAEALYFLSNLWAKTGNPDRATQAKAMLREKHGGSPWASK